ncbi:MAG: glycogen debranching N-terminal domain-containing protein [Chroococcales cyanobacterium]
MELETIEYEGRQYISTEHWAVHQWPCTITQESLPTLTLKADELFLITDTLGNIAGCMDADQTTNLGLFCHDTRFLSRLEFQIEGRSPILLSSSADQGFALSVLCANPHLPNIPAETLGIQRELVLNAGVFEDILITNYNTYPVTVSISLSFDADFVDLFEVRGFKREKRGLLLRQIPEGVDIDNLPNLTELPTNNLTLAYQGLDRSLMESRIQFAHRQPDRIKGYTAIWELSLEPQAKERLGYRMEMLTNSQSTTLQAAPATLGQAKAVNLQEEREWSQHTTQLRSDNETFNQVLHRAEEDIYLLRQSFDDSKGLSAGVPWFSTLFGRDSLIAASQSLVFDPTLARETLNLLANYQGKVFDDWREEEPGKILHEVRLGELARCGEIPHTPYYGTVDATPLWILLYSEYFAWTNDGKTLDQLWPNALAAMDWIDRNCEKTGYLYYKCRSKRGLPNQGWKDSDNCIVDRKGKLAEGAIALCEVQGYVYAAKIQLSQIARMKKRLDLADRWEEEARSLKQRFNRDFWVEDRDYCALALDETGQQMDSITSNPGHCLFTNILTPEKAESVAERLQGPDLFSGWGIRTLSSDSPAYNPMGYHIGSVWPHDNSLIAIGLRSMGRIDQALEISKGLIEMTIQQPYQRPPELFCGYERVEGSQPVRYPVACSPQAWATGSIFQLLKMMVHLVPNAPANRLHILDPVLPDFLNHLSVYNLHIGSTVLDLEFERSETTTACRVTRKRGNLRVIIEA